MVAVLRAMLKLRITSSLPQLLVLVDGLRWIMQNSFNERYAKELAICRPGPILTGGWRSTTS